MPVSFDVVFWPFLFACSFPVPILLIFPLILRVYCPFLLPFIEFDKENTFFNHTIHLIHLDFTQSNQNQFFRKRDTLGMHVEFAQIPFVILWTFKRENAAENYVKLTKNAILSIRKWL
jgi:hypothetical protein